MRRLQTYLEKCYYLFRNEKDSGNRKQKRTFEHIESCTLTLINKTFHPFTDIVSGIFPGRDPGLTLTGDYFPVQGYVQNTPKSSDEAEIINGNSQFQDIQGGENTQNINDQSN